MGKRATTIRGGEEPASVSYPRRLQRTAGYGSASPTAFGDGSEKII